MGPETTIPLCATWSQATPHSQSRNWAWGMNLKGQIWVRGLTRLALQKSCFLSAGPLMRPQTPALTRHETHNLSTLEGQV